MKYNINWLGFYTLFVKEVWRFWKVATQTVLAPVLNVLLYLIVFSSALSKHLEIYPNISYETFLLPGLIMLAILQNAFANSSSSLFQAKQNAGITFVLLAPISSLEFYLAFIGAAIVRGLLVGIGVWVSVVFFIDLPFQHVGLAFFFGIIASALLGAMGLIAAIYSDKWDHIAAFQNFVILPLTFLSGVFYLIRDLPPFWATLSYFNPFFYLIDGFRYSFIGISDMNLMVSITFSSVAFILMSVFTVWLLETGYKLRG
jgi:ABC-2 type transport system permease protein